MVRGSGLVRIPAREQRRATGWRRTPNPAFSMARLICCSSTASALVAANVTIPVLGFAVTESGKTKDNPSNAAATRSPHWIGQCIPVTSTTTRGALGSTCFVGPVQYATTIATTAVATNAETTNNLFRLVGLVKADEAGIKGISANAIAVVSSAFGLHFDSRSALRSPSTNPPTTSYESRHHGTSAVR